MPAKPPSGRRGSARLPSPSARPFGRTEVYAILTLAFTGIGLGWLLHVLFD